MTPENGGNLAQMVNRRKINNKMNGNENGWMGEYKMKGKWQK